MNKPGFASARGALEAAAAAYTAEPGPVTILVGAPLLDYEGGPVFGDFFLLAASGRAAVDGFVARHPFRVAGLWRQVLTRVLQD